jgi:shikimate dehydrogenase
VDHYAVIGNPVAHSLSPRIHRQFAKQTGQALSYKAIFAPFDEFTRVARGFLEDEGGSGLNVTLPFKEPAWRLVDERTARATRAGAVNTICINDQGRMTGDNTDGIGLLRDLTINHGASIEGQHVLVLGAGGAVRGVLGPLLSSGPASLTIVNRTPERAMHLARAFQNLAEVCGCGLEALGNQQFDLIINGTAASLHGLTPAIPDNVLRAGGLCYDLFYAAQPTAFVRWGLEHGAGKSLDGLGMLVEQAAESFSIWRGLRPQTAEVIAALRA